MEEQPLQAMRRPSSPNPYSRARDSVCWTICDGVDWRTYTCASRQRCEALTLSVVSNNAGADTPDGTSRIAHLASRAGGRAAVPRCVRGARLAGLRLRPPPPHVDVPTGDPQVDPAHRRHPRADHHRQRMVGGGAGRRHRRRYVPAAVLLSERGGGTIWPPAIVYGLIGTWQVVERTYLVQFTARRTRSSISSSSAIVGASMKKVTARSSELRMEPSSVPRAS
jgi:hypothetical protein